MPSTLTWIDHSPAERERMQRILALFQEREARDELGFGGIRDAFADRLFPGTSTIQTRLRYMLFVPWMYRRLQAERVPSSQIAARGRRFELALVNALLETEDGGVFGRTAGGGLKRLPSAVYWGGLGAWGIRRFDASQEQYHRTLDEIYRRMARQQPRDDGEAVVDPLTVTWHPKLPPEPPGFPEAADLRLTREDAEFLRERIVASHPDSLLAFLVLHPQRVEADAPWMHPSYADFRPEHRELLEHARLFSQVAYGAAILYNLMLAELACREELEAEHRDRFARWAAGLDAAAVTGWDLDRLWRLAVGHGHTITLAARQLVEDWVRLVADGPGDLADRRDARELVQHREIRLKGARSRFRNRRALEQWGGYAALTRLRYRWPNVQVLLADLFDGLEVA